MFLINSRLGLFTVASFSLAPLLPKLRGHFAEFLNNTSPVGLWIFSSSTCVGLRYGYEYRNRSFSWQCGFGNFLTSLQSVSYFRNIRYFNLELSFILTRVFPFRGFPILLRPSSSEHSQYGNFYPLSIDYVFRPRLRSRLTLGRLALPRNP